MLKLTNDDRPHVGGCFSHVFVQIADQFTAHQWINIAILLRLIILLCMAISCFVFSSAISSFSISPTLLKLLYNDIETFPLRLDDRNHLFALPDSICNDIMKYKVVIAPHKSMKIAIEEENDNSVVTYSSSPIWSFILTPLTRWDAARILRLAYNPIIRYPQRRYQQLLKTEDAADRIEYSTQLTLNETTSQRPCPEWNEILRQSEEAHAFFPLYPLCIQFMVAILLWCIPVMILPSTCEGVVVLAAYLFNTICFLYSAKQLYHMTQLLLLNQPYTNLDGYNKESKPSTNHTSEQWARRVMLLFIINPATLFFNTVYSESFAAALIFTGYHWILQYRVTNNNCRLRQFGLLFGTWFVWYLSCFVRSNGILNGGFLFLFGMGTMLTNHRSAGNVLTSIMLMMGAIVLVVGSVGLYNYSGYRNFCLTEPSTVDTTSISSNSFLANGTDCTIQYVTPEWCANGPSFNVYSYVQRKYWNVGFLRYYRLIKLPNLILGAPVLCISILAVRSWIELSWNRFASQLNEKTMKQHQYLTKIIGWSIQSLQEFASKSYTSIQATEQSAVEMTFMGNPLLLGHYAVLAVCTILGITIAHVQISTRMIFSTCPALYWYLVVKISERRRFGNAIVSWCLLYIVLGIIIHPNWLHWT
jgi:GPI mannosyltransferase 2